MGGGAQADPLSAEPLVYVMYKLLLAFINEINGMDETMLSWLIFHLLGELFIYRSDYCQCFAEYYKDNDYIKTVFIYM